MLKRQHFTFMTVEGGGALLSSVQRAINTLGSGFLAYPTNHSLREKLRDGKLQPQNYYQQVLRLVYRLMILFVAEHRGVLPQLQADKSMRKGYGDYSAGCLRNRP